MRLHLLLSVLLLSLTIIPKGKTMNNCRDRFLRRPTRMRNYTVAILTQTLMHSLRDAEVQHDHLP